MKTECDNCEWVGDDKQLFPIPDEGLGDRIGIGLGGFAVIPAGECPTCGCFAYYSHDCKRWKQIKLAIDQATKDNPIE